MNTRHAGEIRQGILLARADQIKVLKMVMRYPMPDLAYAAYVRTFRRDFMASGGYNRWDY